MLPTLDSARLLSQSAERHRANAWKRYLEATDPTEARLAHIEYHRAADEADEARREVARAADAMCEAIRAGRVGV